MQIVQATLKGNAPLYQSRFHNVDKEPKELADAYEQRTWRHRLHTAGLYQGQVDAPDDAVIINALALKGMMAAIAKYLSVQIPGKGKTTYTKHFKAGVHVPPHPILNYNGKPLMVGDVQPRPMHVPVQAGSGSRVMRIYPEIPPGWEMDVTFWVVDSIISKDVFLDHLTQAGLLTGLGAFRIGNGGIAGSFTIEKFDWKAS